MSKGQVDSGSKEDAQRPPTLNDRIQKTALLGRHLFANDGDGYRRFGIRKTCCQRSDQTELPKFIHKIGQPREKRGSGQAKHPHSAAANGIHAIAGKKCDAELRAEYAKAQKSKARL